MNENSDKNLDGLIEIYKEHVVVISQIKRAQLAVTNYAILLLGGLIFFRADIGTALDATLVKILSIAVPGLIFALGSTVLVKQHSGLRRRRQRIKRIEKHMTTAAQQEVMASSSGDGGSSIDVWILAVCIGVTFVAAALCGVLLWSQGIRIV